MSLDHQFVPQLGSRMCVCGEHESEHGPQPDLRQPLCYIVLTRQVDGGWRDDWDGVAHVSKAVALDALMCARDGGEEARLVACYPIGPAIHTEAEGQQ
jgi:hypothetical protein